MVRSMVAAFLALGLGFAASPAIADDDVGRITVTGRAEAQAVPDIATMSIGVQTEARTPGDALSENAKRMTAVMKQLKDAGIADRDLRTSQLAIWPIHAENRRRESIEGYRVSNQLAVTIRDIDRLGAILDATVADGANSFNGPNFSIGKPEPLLQAARDAAVRDAIAKAERYAAAAEVELGEVMSIDEAGNGPVFARQMRAEAMDAATPVAPGQTTISASVTMTFAINGEAR
ncbi:MAG: SIMPL domain-containing protein [Geminicoccaceae bacterium]